MKLLLTSGGIRNASIRDRLVDLLGKPIEESNALAIPTGTYGHRMCTPETTYNFVTDAHDMMTGKGWKSVGILELTALPTIGRDRWEPWVRETDVFLVDGGDATYLAHWIRASGLSEILPSLTDTVWAGLSAGSMCLTPRIGEDFVAWSAAPDDRTLGLVDFSIFPHLGMTEEHTVDNARIWRDAIGNPAYVLDDQSAIVVADGEVDVVSEGEWHPLP